MQLCPPTIKSSSCTINLAKYGICDESCRESHVSLEVLRRNSNRISCDSVSTQPSAECQWYDFALKSGICDELGSPKCRWNWFAGCCRITPLVCAGRHGRNEFTGFRGGKLLDLANLRQVWLEKDSCRTIPFTRVRIVISATQVLVISPALSKISPMVVPSTNFAIA